VSTGQVTMNSERMFDIRTYRLPGTIIVISVDIRHEPRTVQRVGNVGVKELWIETIEVSILEHVRFRDPGLVVVSCVVDVRIANLVIDAHKEVPDLRSCLLESVFPIGLN